MKQNEILLSGKEKISAFLWLWIGPLVVMAIAAYAIGASADLRRWEINLFITGFFLVSALANGFVVPTLTKHTSIFKSVFAGLCFVIASSFVFDVAYSHYVNDYHNYGISSVRPLLNGFVFVLGHFLLRLFSGPRNQHDFNFPKSSSFNRKIAFWILFPQGLLIAFIFSIELAHTSELNIIIHIIGAFGYAFVNTLTAVLAVFFIGKLSSLKSHTAVFVALTTLLCLCTGTIYGASLLHKLDLATILITGAFPSFFSAGGVIFLLLHYNSNSAKDRKIKWLDRSYARKNSEYQHLKQQTSPHFFFNNLNMLLSFIESDPEKALAFGQRLSNVYRKFLRADDNDFVLLADEMAFISEYLEIYKAKFGDAFDVSIEINDHIDNFILANALQEIIDNIFKHNIFDDEDPIVIELFVEDENLIVRNSICLKQHVESDSVGLENIRKRYELLTEMQFSASKNETFFVVNLPILQSQ